MNSYAGFPIDKTPSNTSDCVHCEFHCRLMTRHIMLCRSAATCGVAALNSAGLPFVAQPPYSLSRFRLTALPRIQCPIIIPSPIRCPASRSLSRLWLHTAGRSADAGCRSAPLPGAQPSPRVPCRHHPQRVIHTVAAAPAGLCAAAMGHHRAA